MSKELETKIPVMGENLEIKKNIAVDNVNIIKEPSNGNKNSRN